MCWRQEALARHAAWALQPADEATADFVEFVGRDRRQRTPSRCDIRARVREQLCSGVLTIVGRPPWKCIRSATFWLRRGCSTSRAAEECNVAQPSLTRAIQQLEQELGGDLFRRERKLSHLIDLGQRMLPLMQQCYDMAQGAKSLANSIKRGEIASLRLALSHTVDISLLVPYLSELTRAFNGLELKCLRGSGLEIVEKLKQGEADLGIAGPLNESWARFDVWPLLTEGFSLVVSDKHRLANQEAIDLDEIGQERPLMRPYCEQAEQITALLRSRNITAAHTYELSSERDLLSLLEANIGAFVPRSITIPEWQGDRVPVP
jgi:DNA-binding transcriptional LysR family regulator